ncbi:MAG: aldehyde ferredoxin oxidoreductase C-terminal domain-containing protein [Thermodesulfobacteriota bacterium]|nr:aldehyde ferredoxin oxidoreductase C-terminal domain-containing protein [Thermodesulfobacteriota bacterium]
MIFDSIVYRKPEIENGYSDRLLEVDLSNKKIYVKEIPEEMRRLFIGGRGYCLKLVYDGTNSKTRYDSEENVLAFAGGPFCGETGFAGTGKFIIGSISPLTNTFCDSNLGGYFFPLVKFAGFDAISVTGKSQHNVLVFIDGDRLEVSIVESPAMDNSLFGAEKLIREWKGDGKPSGVAFVNTGIGGKNTFFGCINSVYYDVRRKRCRAKQAGRGGLGSVMREKGLWGIAVKYDMSKGNSNKPVNRDRLRNAGKKLRNVIREVDPNAMSLGTQGTTCLLDMMNFHNLLPVNNYQYGMDDRERGVSGTVFEEKIFEQKYPDGCFAGCSLACTKGCEEYTLKTGPLAGETIAVDGPEYETAAAVTNLGIFDIECMLEYSWYCDEYGLDTISTGVVMSFLFEAYDRGLLTKEDTGGLELKWGYSETALELLHRIASGEPGFPAEAGRGLRHMKGWIAKCWASRNGRSPGDILHDLELFGMECKGLEFSMYITKESLAQQGGYGFALKGPQHDEAWLIGIDQINNELPTFEKKAMALKWFPLFRTWFNIVGLCKLPWIDVRHPEAKNTRDPSKNFPTIEYYLELVNATLGTEKTIDDLLTESERCYLLHKLINLRQGFGTRKYDLIPLRAMAPVFINEFNSRREYYKKCLIENAGVDIEGKSDEEMLTILQKYRASQYEKLTDEVYREKGYDRNGIPLDETLLNLGLDKDEYFEILRSARDREKVLEHRGRESVVS